MLPKSTVTKVDILWCLKTILSHSLFNSRENILKLVSGLFSYNNFAKSFLLGETKCAHWYCSIFQRFIVRGIIRLFLNARLIEKEQLDILFRFFNETTDFIRNWKLWFNLPNQTSQECESFTTTYWMFSTLPHSIKCIAVVNGWALSQLRRFRAVSSIQSWKPATDDSEYW